ncbi:unnamed protein product [Gemmata massiliana]|uniref:Uncharacterized protein n=1 Tax=Gemmata massiliana TaxID=1210884 RepID=A0A6P2CTB2_9BACT|nr:hypothetical protein [Gemmata massiliana]VTR92189.1 unnamed protein product [Gemmata massiliana]
MERELDVLTMLLLDPCLTADEAAREAAARHHLAVVVAEARDEHLSPRARRSLRAERAPAGDGPAVGF